jgi:hypothetical protein
MSNKPNSSRRTKLWTGCLGLALGLYSTFGAVGADQVAPSVPEPSPTEAGIKGDKPVQVVGRSEGKGEDGHQSALLSGYRQLLEQGARASGLVPDDRSYGYQFFRINDDHPHGALLSWALRASVNEMESTTRQTQLEMTSPPMREIQEDFPKFIKTLAVDTDGDGKMETLGAAYDGRIYLMKSSARGYDRIAQSACLSSYTHVAYRIPGAQEASWDQTRLTQLTDLRSVEILGPGRLRVVAQLQSSESVGGIFLGRANEEREVLIRLSEPGSEPSLELSEPADFTQTTSSSIALKGLFLAPEGLTSARLRYNGRPYWQAPDGLNSRRLKMDLVVPLLPGWNSAQVQAVDSSRRLVSREVLLRRNAPPPAIQPGKRRALLIGVSQYASPNLERVPNADSDVENLKRFIMGPQNGAGFALQNVISLKGSQATRKAILEKLQSLRVEASSPTDQERVFTLIYFRGLSTRTGGGGQGLMPYDTTGVDEGAIRAEDLIDAIGPLGNQDVVLITDTTPNQLTAAKSVSKWLDNQDFADRLEHQGWAVISGSQKANPVNPQVDFSSLLLKSLEGYADSDNDGLIEFDELYRGVFELWKAVDPAAGLNPPMRRGNLLGRMPVVSVAKKP